MRTILILLLNILILPSAFAFYPTTHNSQTGVIDYVGINASSDITLTCTSGYVLKTTGSGTWVCAADGGSGAPIDSKYWVSAPDSTLTDERIVAEGQAIDIADGGAGASARVSFDSTEVSTDQTWASGGPSALRWAWHLSGGSPSITITPTDWFFSGNVRASGDMYIAGDDLFMGTNTAGFILVGDNTNFNPVDMSGDIDIDSAGATAIQADVVSNDEVATQAVSTDQIQAVNKPTDAQVLSYNAASLKGKWVTSSGSGTPGGSDTQVQFNDAGSFGGDAGFVYDKTNDTITLIGSANANRLLLRGHSTQGPIFTAEENGGVDLFVIEAPAALSGSSNHISGAGAGGNITSGASITAYGTSACGGVSTTDQNTCIGGSAGINNTGTLNAFLGFQAGRGGSFSGSYNLAAAYNTMFNATSADFNVVLGGSAAPTLTTGDGNICIGFACDLIAASQYAIALGYGATTTASNQMAIGGDGSGINDVYIGESVTNATPISTTINATGGSGTDISGGDLALAAGKSTGNATGGELLFQTATPGSTGTTLQTLATRGSFKQSGVFNLVPQASPPASPVSGDMYVDSTPSPDALCFYNGTDWDDISTAATDANCA